MKKMNAGLLLCAVVTLVVVAGGIWSVTAEDPDEVISDETRGFGFCFFRRWRGPFGNIWRSLSEEQREELLLEIKDLISSKLEEWGLEPPEPLLTEEQLEDLKSMVEEMRDTGATPEEIKAAIADLLGEWGVELPERPMKRGLFQSNGEVFRERRGCCRRFRHKESS